MAMWFNPALAIPYYGLNLLAPAAVGYAVWLNTKNASYAAIAGGATFTVVNHYTGFWPALRDKTKALIRYEPPTPPTVRLPPDAPTPCSLNQGEWRNSVTGETRTIADTAPISCEERDNWALITASIVQPTTQLVTPTMCGPMPDTDAIHGIDNVTGWLNSVTGERVAVGAMIPCSTAGQWTAQV